jgi:hypothetical protein
MRRLLWFAAVTLVTAGLPAPVSAQVDVRRDDRVRLSPDVAPAVDLWLDQISFDRGVRMRPHVTSEPGAYLVVLRVTTDGELRVMYPEQPRLQKPYAPGRFVNDAVPYAGSTAFLTWESSGNGFVFAIASYEPFDFSTYTRGGSWRFDRLADFRRVGDPFEVVRRFLDDALPQTAEYSLDYEMYEVYARGLRGQYSGGYRSIGYWGIDDYHSACLSAFGYRMDYYCRPYRGRYYGPIIIASNPRAPRPRAPGEGGKKMRPPAEITNEPAVPKSPVTPVEGTTAANSRADYAEREYERRLRARTLPRREADSEPGQRSSNPRFGNPRTSSPQPESRRMPELREPVIYRTMPVREHRPDATPHRQQPSARESQRAEPRAPVGTIAPREHRMEQPRPRDKS